MNTFTTRVYERQNVLMSPAITPVARGTAGMDAEITHRINKLIPLSAVMFQILLALATQTRHGYGIMKEVHERSRGRVKLRPGSLYRSLNRLQEVGALEETDPEDDSGQDDERRRYYCLTPFGQTLLRAEAHRLRDLVEAAYASDIIDGAGST